MKFKEYLVVYKELEKPASTFFHRHVSKNGAKVFSFVALKIGLSPNAISFLSFILLFLGCFLITTGNEMSLWFSLLALQLSYICDCSDGVVARFTKTSSNFGGYLDIFLDRVGGAIFLATLSYFAFAVLGVDNVFLFSSSLLLFYFYHLSATFRPYYFPELKGYMKRKGSEGSVMPLLKAFVKFTYEFIDSGIFYFVMCISLIFGWLEMVAYFYGLVASILLSANILFLYKHKR
ncbi:hypothetical protein TUM3794_39630 [Shewanella colwelliana]|uniref:CDP-alcohol phosphatidyltransferase n=1 Tax=Shewanella colwelliana TaxID=23 RepID=A0ABQ4PGE7_SHECO|nr:CDP-alcohol phosphatidyltransferase family protein [Shewanella colwelliana]GIU46642.1 hypothetical protein TUM3794_39630 [Shewanella colwelliana]